MQNLPSSLKSQVNNAVQAQPAQKLQVPPQVPPQVQQQSPDYTVNTIKAMPPLVSTDGDKLSQMKRELL